MAESVVQRTPPEVWTAILDWALYDRDTLEFNIEHPVQHYHDNRVIYMGNKIGILRLVCKSWYRCLSASYDVRLFMDQHVPRVRLASHTHLIDYGGGRWNVHTILESRQLVYIEMTYRPFHSEPATINKLLHALTAQSRLRYLTLMFISKPFTMSKPPSSLFLFQHLRGFFLKFTRPGVAIPAAVLLQLRLPVLTELGIQMWHGDSIQIAFVVQLVTHCGHNLEILMLEVLVIHSNDRVPMYLPPVLWNHIPKLQTLRIQRNVMLQFPHSTLFPHISSLLLPETLDTISIMSPNIWSLGNRAEFAKWISESENSRGGGPRLLTIKLEATWEDFGGIGMQQSERFAEVVRWYNNLSQKGAIRLTDIDGTAIEDIETYLIGLAERLMKQGIVW